MAFGAEMITFRQNVCINFFEKQNAYSYDTAIASSYVFNNPQIHMRTIGNLIKSGVIVEKNDKLYLDKSATRKFKKSIKRYFLV